MNQIHLVTVPVDARCFIKGRKVSPALTGEAYVWLITNVGAIGLDEGSWDYQWGNYVSRSTIVFAFANSNHALLFKLTWGGV